MRILCTLLILTGALFAQSVDSFKPDCGAEGHWVCPPGWDFGGFGESCTVPGDE